LRRYIDELLLPGGGGGPAMADKLAKADFHGAMVRVVRQSPLTRTLADRTAVAWQHLRALCLYYDALYIYLTPRWNHHNCFDCLAATQLRIGEVLVLNVQPFMIIVTLVLCPPHAHEQMCGCCCCCCCRQVRSRCPSLVGVSGIVLHETENTVVLMCNDDHERTVPKRNSVFALRHGESLVTIHGSHICFRASERARHKFKPQGTVDLWY
jgi:RNase P/RNase MRP subunit p29